MKLIRSVRVTLHLFKTIHYKSQIDIGLSLETALASTLTTTIQPIGVVVVASTYGEPLTIEDGESIFSWNSSQYSETFTHYSTRYTEQQRVYYSMLLNRFFLSLLFTSIFQEFLTAHKVNRGAGNHGSINVIPLLYRIKPNPTFGK